MGSVMVFCDSQSALALIGNATCSQRTKHIAVQYHHVRELAAAGTLALRYVHTSKMAADALTKPLPKASYDTERVAMGLSPQV